MKTKDKEIATLEATLAELQSTLRKQTISPER